MAKKKVKVTETKKVVVPEPEKEKDKRDSVKLLVKMIAMEARLTLLEQRLNRIVTAIDKSKSVRGL